MPAGDVTVPGLTIYEEIGRGGFATVYRAHDSDFDRDVAVKVLQTRLDPDGLARFQRECAAVGVISHHPNIVAVHRSGVSVEGYAYLVMELLTGGSLAGRAAGRGLPWRDGVGLGVALAGALETAHGAGVLHRDVKPENILFSAFQAPVLVDFGIAAVRGGYETRSSTITASLAHAAPEVIAGARASAASDVYALASTLFFALSGRPPFTADGEETLVPLIARIATAPPPDLRPMGVPDPVAAVVETALAKDAGARPVSAAAFADDLVGAAARAGLNVTPAIVPASAVAAMAAPEAESVTRAVGRRTAPPATVDSEVAGRSRRPLIAAAAGILLLAAAGGGAWVLSAQDSGPGQTVIADPVPATTAAATTSPTSRPPASPTATPKATPSPSQQVLQPTPTGDGQTTTTSASPGPTVASRAPSPTPAPANRAPTLAVVSNQQNDELSAVSLRARGSDPDGDRLTYAASGLPRGVVISPSSGVISGTISAGAANVTVDRRQGIRVLSLRVTVRVSDGKLSTSRALTWQVRDTHRTMPDYYGKYGCNGDGTCSESVPNISAVSTPGFFCTSEGTVPNETIARQSVAAGAVIRWGQAINYTYKRAAC